MTDTATRFFGPSEPSTSDTTTVFAAPSGVTLIIRNIHAQNPTGSAATLTIGKDDTTTSAKKFLEAFSIPAGNTYDWSGFLVIPSGETWYIKQGSANALTVIASGVEVS